ncbi:MAG: GNAT family N-acetyltransferase, partial [Saprospiraceae bacterium]|nr:GNAT family N-acetyltransferase [Saprospiraceae bacterium]
MFQLSTTRLRLIPLNPGQAQLLITSREALERQLGLNISSLELSADSSFWGEFESAMQEFVLPMLVKYPQQYEWFTHWLIVHDAANLTIGGIGIGGLPNQNGETMLGYFIDRRFEGQGFATEAVKELAGWLFQNESLKWLIADIPVGHLASQKVLQKNGFVFAGAVEE